MRVETGLDRGQQEEGQRLRRFFFLSRRDERARGVLSNARERERDEPAQVCKKNDDWVAESTCQSTCWHLGKKYAYGSCLPPSPSPEPTSSPSPRPTREPTPRPTREPTPSPTESFLRITGVGTVSTCVAEVECPVVWVYRGDADACATVKLEFFVDGDLVDSVTTENDGSETKAVSAAAELAEHSVTISCTDVGLFDTATFAVSSTPAPTVAPSLAPTPDPTPGPTPQPSPRPTPPAPTAMPTSSPTAYWTEWVDLDGGNRFGYSPVFFFSRGLSLTWNRTGTR